MAAVNSGGVTGELKICYRGHRAITRYGMLWLYWLGRLTSWYCWLSGGFSCVVRFGLEVATAASTPVCCTDCIKVKAGVNAVSIPHSQNGRKSVGVGL